jgi:ribosomal protein S18
MDKKNLKHKNIRTFQAKRTSPIKVDIKDLDYKNPALLIKYVSILASIKSADANGLSRCLQKKLTKSVKRARFLGMLPYRGHITKST